MLISTGCSREENMGSKNGPAFTFFTILFCFCFVFFSEEKAEVAIAVLPYLMRSRTGTSQVEDFVHFIPVSALPKLQKKNLES